MLDKENKPRRKMVVEEVKSEEALSEVNTTIPEPIPAAVTPEPKAEEIINNDIPEPLISTVPVIETPQQAEVQKKSFPTMLFILIPGIFLLGAILGGIFYYQKSANKVEEVETPTPSPSSAPLVTPTASASSSINLNKYTITVYNGSGIAGEAGRAKTILTDAGFKVGSTTNAASYDYTKLIIKAKSTVEAEFINKLKITLETKYVVDTPQTLATSSADVVQVVVGSSQI